MQKSQAAMLAAKDLLAHAMAPVYRVINGLLVVTVFMVVGLWLSGNGTNAGAFDLARILVPDEARHIVWSNGFGMLDQYKTNEPAATASDTDIATVIYQKSGNHASGLQSAKQQTIALLMPSVAQVQVRSISHLADRIPVAKVDPEALDSNLMGSIQNQRAVADFYEKKYGLNRAKIEEYVSNTILIAKEVNIDPVLLLAVIAVESNFNPNTFACQFSWTCDPLHNKTTNIQSRWSESVKVAQVAVASKQSMADITEGATHFHAAYVKPVWAKTLRRVAQIDDHLFYKR